MGGNREEKRGFWGETVLKCKAAERRTVLETLLHGDAVGCERVVVSGLHQAQWDTGSRMAR